MIGKALTEVTVRDLEDLKDNCVCESRTIEYKVQLTLGGREDRIELLADVTAFANTSGGDLVFGVAEKQGEPTALPGIDIANWDELQRTLVSLTRDGTEPRLQGVELHRVANGSGKYVLIARIPRSHQRPHRVILGGHGHFYGRDASQKYRLGVEQLRRIFTQVAAVSDVVQRFRAERTEALRQDNGFSPMPHTPKVALHLVPERSLLEKIDIDPRVLGETALRPLPRAALGYSDRVALEAVCWHNEWAYTALYRNGIVEAVEGLIVHKMALFPTPLQHEIIAGLGTYLPRLSAIGITPPVHVLLTLIGVKGCSFPPWSLDALFQRRRPWPDDVLELNGPTLESLDLDPALALRPLFDRLWNAFGYSHCLDYDDSGAWHPRERSVLA